jgi:hypothetical protein
VIRPDVPQDTGGSVPVDEVRARRRPSIVAVAVVGILLGHVITYVLLVPGADERAVILQETGHGYFPVALQAALVVAALSLASWFLGAIARRDRAVGSPSLFARLARLQIAGFVAMEIAERLASGTPLLELVHDHIAVGIAVQLVVAWLGARLLAALGRVAERIGGSEDAYGPRVVLGVAAPCGDVNGRLVAAAPSARGPPGPAISVR